MEVVDVAEASGSAAAQGRSPAIRTHVVVEGESGGGVPTVLIHGVGSDLTRWDRVAAALAPYGLVIRYDLRGHGNSPKPPGPYVIDDFVADHMRLLADLGIGRANVVGFSLGGLIAQRIALKHPESVARLVIISAVAGRTEEQRAAVAERLRTVEEGGPALVADGGARWYTDAFRAEHPDLVQEHLDRFRGNDPAAYTAAFRVLATTDLVDELHLITAPTLVMTGALDVGSPPAMAETMHARIKGSELVIVPGVKHAIFEEAPRAVADAVTGFLHPGRGDAAPAPLPSPPADA